MDYEISFKNHFRVLVPLIILAILLFLGFNYIKQYSNGYYPEIGFYIAFIYLVICIPVLYLHLEYLCYSLGSRLEINNHSKKIIFKKGLNSESTYNFQDIIKINVYLPPSWHRKWDKIQYLPFEQYHYACIYTKSGEEIILTCLLAQRVEDAVSVIKGVPIERKKRLFASILLK